jgi:hypothetical protein
MTTSLSRGAQIAGGAAIVLLISLFLSWYGVDLGPLGAAAEGAGVDTSASAWQAFSWTDLLLFLTVLVTLAWVGGTATGNVQAAQLKQVAMAAGAVMALLVLYRIVNQPGPNDLITVKFGAFVGLLACAAIAYGAFSADEA